MIRGESNTYWRWYPMIDNATWPAMKLKLITSTSTELISASHKGARTAAPIEGKSYYFYAIWSGTAADTPLDFIAPKVVHVANAGGLATAITAHGYTASSIDKMIVTGKLNKADFDLMKDNMKLLTYIDLSDVDMTIFPDNAFGDWSASLPNKTIEKVILPKTLTKIGSGAFLKCSSLSGCLIIPENVTEIGADAFRDCSGLTGQLILSSTLKIIGSDAFHGCSNFTGSINLPSGLTALGYNAFQNCAKFTGDLDLGALTNLELKAIRHNAFAGCTGLDGTLTLPSNLEWIQNNAFNGCTKLNGALTIPNTVTTIEEEAFYKCSAFIALDLSTQLVTIGKSAFHGCSGFRGNITFPSTLTSIGIQGFQGCSTENEFQFPYHSSPIAPYNSQMLPAGATVKVPNGKSGNYSSWTGSPRNHTIVEY